MDKNEIEIDALTTELDLILNNDQDSYNWLQEMGRDAIDVTTEAPCGDIGGCVACMARDECDDKEGEIIDSEAAISALEDDLEQHFFAIADVNNPGGVLGSILWKALGLIDFRTIAKDTITSIIED